MASRRLRETPHHKLRLQCCCLSAEICASLRFVCLRTDDKMLNDAHFNYSYVALHVSSMCQSMWHYIPSMCQRKELCFKRLEC